MKHFLFLTLLLALCACRTQSTIAHRAHYPQSTIHDSVSITYKQGQTLTPTLSLIGQGGSEQPTPTGVRGAAIEPICVIEESEQKQPCQSETLTSCEAHSTGKGCALATRNKKGAAIAMAVNSPQGVRNSEASGRLIIRVDTVFVERWHTQTIREPTTLPYEGKAGKGSFYKNCTWGFFILLLLILGRIALKMWKGFFFHS